MQPRCAGHSVELLSVSDADDIPLDGLDGAVLAGSLHAGHYQEALVDFVRDRRVELDRIATLFLSVSLSAAGAHPDDLKGLDECPHRFQVATDHSLSGEPAQGAEGSRYDFFRYWAMRWIASQMDEEARSGEDREYTDWVALGAALEDWVRG
ncbi:MAG: flavodoxin domain-containing protein [Paracoccaceae bacterium]